MFDCFKMHSKCKALCCKCVPIEKEIYQRNQHRLLRKVSKEIDFPGYDPIEHKHKDLVVPETEDGYCPFLQSDYKCGIEDDKPSLCKKYGTSEDELLRCPFQDPCGRVRSRQEVRKIHRDTEKRVEKLKVICEKNH